MVPKLKNLSWTMLTLTHLSYSCAASPGPDLSSFPGHFCSFCCFCSPSCPSPASRAGVSYLCAGIEMILTFKHKKHKNTSSTFFAKYSYLKSVWVEHGIDGGLRLVHHGSLGVQRAAGEGGQPGELEASEVGRGHLGPEVGLDDVQVGVDVVLERGAVPAPLSELVLTLVNGSHCSQADGVHEPGISFTKFNLKKRVVLIFPNLWNDFMHFKFQLVWTESALSE